MSETTQSTARQMGEVAEEPLSDAELEALFDQLPGRHAGSFGGEMDPAPSGVYCPCCSPEKPHLRSSTNASRYEHEQHDSRRNLALVLVEVDTRQQLTALAPFTLRGRGRHVVELLPEELDAARRMLISDRHREVWTQATAVWRRKAIEQLSEEYGRTPTSVRERWTLATVGLSVPAEARAIDKSTSALGTLFSVTVLRELEAPKTLENVATENASSAAAQLELMREQLAQSKRMLDFLVSQTKTK